MNLKEIKKIVQKWIEGSGKKQLKVFTKDKKRTSIFLDILKSNKIK